MRRPPDVAPPRLTLPQRAAPAAAAQAGSERSANGVGQTGPMLAAASDPTGLSSPVGKLIMIAGLLAVLVLLIMAWRRKR